ncbi:hypothetical protein L226DRAFT_307555 [Lentinus tigrinus ALCF2SS1-7]|uniref:uncharacterized protein n=1 Tax=Lentinus tigrinus ALCF2SS1-7 TaxID=1328758 RepID=UPI0011662A39|nr:hypothetical protein L226DRAFT_307555 [Lentinus tigrinus ALCF2SS1-7]
MRLFCVLALARNTDLAVGTLTLSLRSRPHIPHPRILKFCRQSSTLSETYTVLVILRERSSRRSTPNSA